MTTEVMTTETGTTETRTTGERCREIWRRCFLGVMFLLACTSLSRPAPAADDKVVLVVTADASDYILAAGGTIAKMIDDGATAYLVRVTNDDKDSWGLSAEETAVRTRRESEQAAEIHGFE